jgi:hypothetical protein
MEKPKRYRKPAPLNLRIFKKRYDYDRNPAWLMEAFTLAYDYNLSIPIWVRGRLNQFFKDFLCEPGASLDTLMGCTKGKGQAPAKTDIARRDRAVVLVAAVDGLRRQGMTVSDATVIAHSYCRSLSQLQPDDDYYDERAELPPAIEEVRQECYEWNRELDKIRFYPEHFIKDILKTTPYEIRVKYPSLFPPALNL